MPLTLLVDGGHSVLNSPAQPVYGDFWKEIPALVKELHRVCDLHNGLGLAAPQVGVPLAVAVVHMGRHRFEIVNPRVVARAGRELDMVEGCLSLPGKEYLVPRWTEVKVEFQDKRGKTRLAVAGGLEAQVFQHEILHLQGRLLSTQGPDTASLVRPA